VVNIKGVKELGGIQNSKTGLRIGATVTIDELLETPKSARIFRRSRSARGVASPQIRNMGQWAAISASGRAAGTTGRASVFWP